MSEKQQQVYCSFGVYNRYISVAARNSAIRQVQHFPFAGKKRSLREGMVLLETHRSFEIRPADRGIACGDPGSGWDSRSGVSVFCLEKPL